jgi:hypothetical protein
MKKVLISEESQAVIVAALRALQGATAASYAMADFVYNKEAMGQCDKLDRSIESALVEIQVEA